MMFLASPEVIVNDEKYIKGGLSLSIEDCGSGTPHRLIPLFSAVLCNALIADCELIVNSKVSKMTLWLQVIGAKYIDVENDRLPAQLREMPNSEEKKKIHTALFDPEEGADFT